MFLLSSFHISPPTSSFQLTFQTSPSTNLNLFAFSSFLYFSSSLCFSSTSICFSLTFLCSSSTSTSLFLLVFRSPHLHLLLPTSIYFSQPPSASQLLSASSPSPCASPLPYLHTHLLTLLICFPPHLLLLKILFLLPLFLLHLPLILHNLPLLFLHLTPLFICRLLYLLLLYSSLVHIFSTPSTSPPPSSIQFLPAASPLPVTIHLYTFNPPRPSPTFPPCFSYSTPLLPFLYLLLPLIPPVLLFPQQTTERSDEH